MTNLLRPAVLCACLAVLTVGAGCATNPNATADIPDDRAPLTSPGMNTLNSPTAGPTSAGLPGGTIQSDPPELDPNRGTNLERVGGR